MNSLTYLSRQFDVLASARTPPPTPTNTSPNTPSPRQSTQKAASLKTWSAKSFLFFPSTSSSRYLSKRPLSSPADYIASAPVRPALTSSSDTPNRQRRKLQGFLRGIFFIQFSLFVWDILFSAWASMVRVVARRGAVPEMAPLDEMQYTEEQDKTIDHKSQLPPTERKPSFPRSYTDSSLTSESKPESETSSLLPPSSTTDQNAVPSSRSSTPISSTRKTPFHSPKTLVLDLDETLIHSTSRAIMTTGTSGSGLLGLATFGRRNKGAGHTVEVVLGGRSTLYHVYKRPFVDFFLRTVSGWYTVVIFTASMQEYADPVIDWLDAGRGILAHRFFRDSCTQLPNGSYTKDLSVVEPDLSRICLVDNSPISYRINEANGIPIEGWTHDPSDEALLDLLPVLDSLRFTSDVRRVLGIRGFS